MTISKFIVAFAFVFMAVPFAASAATDIKGQPCVVPPDQGIFSADGKGTLVGCIKEVDWDRAQKEAQERQSRNDLPIVVRGTASITDEYGVVYDNPCPTWFPMNCVDLTRTEAYRESMRTIARDLIRLGYDSSFPRFAGWIKSVR